MRSGDWAKKTVRDIKAALKQFGEYSFCDKGAHEVMEMPSLKDMSGEEARSALLGILDAKGLKPEVKSVFVQEMLVDHQEMPDDWFKILMDEPRLASLY